MGTGKLRTGCTDRCLANLAAEASLASKNVCFMHILWLLVREHDDLETNQKQRFQLRTVYVVALGE